MILLFKIKLRRHIMLVLGRKRTEKRSSTKRNIRKVSKSKIPFRSKKNIIRQDTHILPIFNEQSSISLVDDLFEPVLCDNALTVLTKRYFKKDDNGKVVEDAKGLFMRVASDIAKAEEKYNPKEVEKYTKIFYKMMAKLDFLPNSPTLMNAGKSLQQLSACFVLPIGDSMEEIFEAVKQTALIHKSGGGTGFSFSKLRSNGSLVKSTSGIASGPVSFINVFNAATETIKQGGTRRGANMAMLRVDHPEIVSFIDSKKDQKSLNNFNISVAITDEFMQAFYEGKKYNLIEPHTKEVVGQLCAKDIFQKIVENAHLNGEPGIVFIDKMNKFNPTPTVGEIEATNPCGEQPLLPHESCNLGSINLSNFVDKNGKFNFERLNEIINYAVRFLDNVIDRNNYPLEIIKKVTLSNRKIGLGVMGFAEALIKMKIPYDSDKAIETGSKIMKFIQDKGIEYSSKLAIERGNFPNYEKSIFFDKKIPMRNATVTTIAPTGTISIIANTSSGIEPLFALSYYRNVLDGAKLIEVNNLFKSVLMEKGIFNEKLLTKITEAGSARHIEELPDDIKEYFVTSHDIKPKGHVRMQSAFQKYTDNAVSKTVNLPNSASKEDVQKVYLDAYELGCKGVTVYRDGSRMEQVLVKSVDEKPKDDVKTKTVSKKRELKILRKRPTVTSGKTISVKTGCGRLYITINEDEYGLCELFSTMGKSGGCTASQCEAISRLISLSFKSGIDVNEITMHLKGISCSNPIWTKTGQVLSCSDAIAQCIEIYLEGRKNAPVKIEPPKGAMVTSGGCPTCGGTLVNSEGCAHCRICGYSKCL